jgi:hypothetical protein
MYIDVWTKRKDCEEGQENKAKDKMIKIEDKIHK